jgi:hypothetical protein
MKAFVASIVINFFPRFHYSFFSNMKVMQT